MLQRSNLQHAFPQHNSIHQGVLCPAACIPWNLAMSCPKLGAAPLLAIAAALQDGSATGSSSSGGALHEGRKRGLVCISARSSCSGFLTSPSFSSGCCEVFCLLHGLSWLSEAAAAREWFTDIWSAEAGVPFACCRSSAPSCNANMSHRPHTRVRTHSNLLIQGGWTQRTASDHGGVLYAGNVATRAWG